MNSGERVYILRGMRMMRVAMAAALCGVAVSSGVAAQTGPVWVMEQSGTTAGLRGIESVDERVAWASGTGGTVLRTVDGGEHWTKCATPDGGRDGATLDFRGVQAWDGQTAIVMASGPGEKSRLYKTTDGCGTWKLVFTNPDKDGFFDSLGGNTYIVALLGDPVDGEFPAFYSMDRGNTWARYTDRKIRAMKGEAVFAASNRCMLPPSYPGELSVEFISGGRSGAYLHSYHWHWIGDLARWQAFEATKLPMGGSVSSGAFAIAMGCSEIGFGERCPIVIVGGDYTKPNERERNAVYAEIPDHSLNVGQVRQAQTAPHGYRSAVEWSEALKVWITVGTNGSDVSRDDGKTWEPLDDGNWNALSLPFVVGPGGRIARLNAAAVAPR